MMRVEHLQSYGLPEIVVKSWQERLGENLLPLQERAVIENRVLGGESVLICAPTSAGKTFCGELAATAAIFRRRKAIFLVPLKSIAEERYREFTKRYAALGIRVLIATADHQEHDSRLERGEFDLAILIYEKFNQLLIKNIDLLAPIELIVIDEVQMIGDEERGAVLELALTKVLMAQRRPQIVALSATLANAEDLADWLGCRLLNDSFRPVELRHGVLANGRYRYRSGNAEGIEELAGAACDEPEQALIANVEHLVGRDEQVLVFLKSRRACEALAYALAERSFRPRAATTIEQLEREPATCLGAKLIATLDSGVAFHHADLSYRQRRILEEGYRRGEIAVLVSTTTLAMGVNLPAQSVFIDCYKFQLGKQTGRPLIVPLEWSEYEAMSGRAGRFGQGGEFGRSIVIAGSPLEAEMLWKMYVTGNPARLESRLAARSLLDVLLDVIAAKAARSLDDLSAALRRTFPAAETRMVADDEIEAAVEQLARRRLVFVQGEALEASPLGRTVSLRGISAASAGQLLGHLREYSGRDELSWCYVALALAEAGRAPIYRSYADEQAGELRRRLCEYVGAHADVAPLLARMTGAEYVLSESELVRLKGALLLCDWLAGVPTLEIEQRYHCALGSIVQLGEVAGWLIETAAALAEHLNKPEDFVQRLNQIAVGARRGFDLPDTIFAEAGFGAEERDWVVTLFDAGWTTRAQLAEASRAALAQLVGESGATDILTKIEKVIKETKVIDGEEEKPMPMLKLRGDMRGERVHIHFDNSEIDLTPKSFNYLYKLGAARLTRPDGWLSKDEIEPGFNQAKNIYRVKQELKRFATGLEERIENNKSGFYRLNLRPEQIKIDIDSMKAYSDLELAELTKQVERSPVC